jgi:hypothetical protein
MKPARKVNPEYARNERVGWIARIKIFSPSGRGRVFFLTSLFIELIEP